MNTLDYIKGLFEIAIQQDEVSHSTLLLLSDRIIKELNNPLYKTVFELVNENASLASSNRKCCISYDMTHDKIDIKFG